MQPKILFYVSGHGYGHAIRCSELIRVLGVPVFVRTVAPAVLFGDLPVLYSRADFDSGVVETDGSLGVDVAATVAGIRSVFCERERIIERELEFIRVNGIERIVADVPFIAGDIAAAAGIPCIGVSNFTWEWIYGPYLERFAGSDELTAIMRTGYAKMTRFCRLPFHHAEGFEIFQQVDDVPLVARQPTKGREEVLQMLGYSLSDSRPRILVGMRGRLGPGALEAAAVESPDFDFIHLDQDVRTETPNSRYVQTGNGLRYPDVLQVCDVAVSKFGYGMVSECVANRKPMLVPPRVDFREDEVFRGEAGRYIPIQEITRTEFQAGRWRGQLRLLLDAKLPENSMRTDGAAVCAEIIMKT